jgi:hypothetical protein
MRDKYPAAFLFGSAVFVWRSFYRRRIGANHA